MRCRRGCRRRWASWPVTAKEGLLALSVGVGLGVLAELMEAEVEIPVGLGLNRPARSN